MADFLPYQEVLDASQVANLYFEENVRLYGMSQSLPLLRKTKNSSPISEELYGSKDLIRTLPLVII